MSEAFELWVKNTSEALKDRIDDETRSGHDGHAIPPRTDDWIADKLREARQAATQEKLPPEICKEGHPVACFQVVEEHHSFHSCAWCADKAKLEARCAEILIEVVVAESLLRPVQLEEGVDYDAWKILKNIINDNPSQHLLDRLEKAEAERDALRKVVELVACGDKDRVWEVSTAKYLIAKAEAALKEDQHERS